MALFPMRPVDTVWRLGLVKLADSLPYGTEMLEVGSFSGESAEIFLGSKKVKSIFCVEPFIPDLAKDVLAQPEHAGVDFGEVRREFVRRVLDGYSGQSELLEMTSEEAAAVALERGLKFDFVYIDGQHDYESVHRDITLWHPFVKTGGIIGGHDHWDGFPGVERAVKELLGGADALFEDTSWIKRV